MVLLGLLLLAAAVVVAIEFILANRGPVTIKLWGWSWHNQDAYWLAVSGAIILVAAVIGLALMKAGGARQWRLRRERRDLAKENKRLNARSGRTDQPEQVTHERGSSTPQRTAAAEPAASAAYQQRAEPTSAAPQPRSAEEQRAPAAPSPGNAAPGAGTYPPAPAAGGYPQPSGEPYQGERGGPDPVKPWVEHPR